LGATGNVVIEGDLSEAGAVREQQCEEDDNERGSSNHRARVAKRPKRKKVKAGGESYAAQLLPFSFYRFRDPAHAAGHCRIEIETNRS
jgi:hypothetical protein